MSYLPRDYSTLICSIRNLDICFLRLREHISSEGQCLGERKNINILYRSRVLLVGVSWSYFYSRILCANAQWKSQRKMTASDNPAIVKLGKKKIKRHEKKKLLIIIIEKINKSLWLIRDCLSMVGCSFCRAFADKDIEKGSRSLENWSV